MVNAIAYLKEHRATFHIVRKFLHIEKYIFSRDKETFCAIKDSSRAIKDFFCVIEKSSRAVKKFSCAIKETFCAVKKFLRAVKETFCAVKKFLRAVKETFCVIKITYRINIQHQLSII
jgi:hypothetical protein